VLVCRVGIAVAAVFTFMLQAQPAGGPLSREDARQRAKALSALGRKLFSDPRLSRSGQVSCSSCHDPAFAYGPPNARPVQPGGPEMQAFGMRAVPSLRYLQAVPHFSEHFFDESGGDDSVDAGPTGGLTWDGRVDRGREQARIPLLSPLEMANAKVADVVASALGSDYALDLKRLAGRRASILRTFDTILDALQAWQEEPDQFYPYSSKYDAWLAGKARLSEQEERGRRLFIDPSKGDCARCHIAERGANGTPPQFTDYGLIALGVPRNPEVPANSNPDWYDLGMCGPQRTDLQKRHEYCGRFRTPSLRNVATRSSFFHNGVFHTLKEVVEFYARRDTHPDKWYPRDRSGTLQKFNDLPDKYNGNIEMGTPFGGEEGSNPSLDDAAIDDVIAFLKTLTDGYRQEP